MAFSEGPGNERFRVKMQNDGIADVIPGRCESIEPGSAEIPGWSLRTIPE